jgi:hypothetical protein
MQDGATYINETGWTNSVSRILLRSSSSRCCFRLTRERTLTSGFCILTGGTRNPPTSISMKQPACHLNALQVVTRAATHLFASSLEANGTNSHISQGILSLCQETQRLPAFIPLALADCSTLLRGFYRCILPQHQSITLARNPSRVQAKPSAFNCSRPTMTANHF